MPQKRVDKVDSNGVETKINKIASRCSHNDINKSRQEATEKRANITNSTNTVVPKCSSKISGITLSSMENYSNINLNCYGSVKRNVEVEIRLASDIIDVLKNTLSNIIENTNPNTDNCGCVCDGRHPKKLIIKETVTEWITELPIQTDECSANRQIRKKMVDVFIFNLNKIPTDSNFEENVKTESLALLQHMPMWKPKNEAEIISFNNVLVNELVTKLRNNLQDNMHSSSSESLSNKNTINKDSVIETEKLKINPSILKIESRKSSAIAQNSNQQLVQNGNQSTSNIKAEATEILKNSSSRHSGKEESTNVNGIRETLSLPNTEYPDEKNDEQKSKDSKLLFPPNNDTNNLKSSRSQLSKTKISSDDAVNKFQFTLQEQSKHSRSKTVVITNLTEKNSTNSKDFQETGTVVDLQSNKESDNTNKTKSDTLKKILFSHETQYDLKNTVTEKSNFCSSSIINQPTIVTDDKYTNSKTDNLRRQGPDPRSKYTVTRNIIQSSNVLISGNEKKTAAEHILNTINFTNGCTQKQNEYDMKIRREGVHLGNLNKIHEDTLTQLNRNKESKSKQQSTHLSFDRKLSDTKICGGKRPKKSSVTVCDNLCKRRVADSSTNTSFEYFDFQCKSIQVTMNSRERSLLVKPKCYMPYSKSISRDSKARINSCSPQQSTWNAAQPRSKSLFTTPLAVQRMRQDQRESNFIGKENDQSKNYLQLKYDQKEYQIPITSSFSKNISRPFY